MLLSNRSSPEGCTPGRWRQATWIETCLCHFRNMWPRPSHQPRRNANSPSLQLLQFSSYCVFSQAAHACNQTLDHETELFPDFGHLCAPFLSLCAKRPTIWRPRAQMSCACLVPRANGRLPRMLLRIWHLALPSCSEIHRLHVITNDHFFAPITV